ncbi:MAG: TIGR03621 family F420-dependent LLM class oxidoreductase [Acidimicrobiia bacterium]|nr:TIGR03621 family F420-dependent LLM class oxidoreductase [Acidimicrobiia bacterium]
MTRPFRFGVQTKTASSRAEWVELARKIEDRGYSSLTMPDHFDDQLAPSIALMAAADATETLRIGALVWCNDYRHPAMLAKEAATLDLLSDGRLELGIGAGWMSTDYAQAGLEHARAGLRIERTVEAVEVMRGLFGDGPFSYDGDHYTIAGLDGTPKPIQKPHPPFLIGGGGRRMLMTAGRLADIVGVNPNMSSGEINADTALDATPERYEEKLSWVREGAGDRFDDIELQVRTFIVQVTDDRRAVAEMLASGMNLSVEQGLASPLAMIGTPAQIADDLRARRERYGFSYIVVGAEEFEAFAPVVADLAGN